MRAVNLLPPDDRRAKRRQASPALISAVGTAVTLTVILAAWFLMASAGVASNQKRLEQVQAALAATPVPPPAAPGTSELDLAKTARISALSQALAGRLAWDRVLRELSLVLPDDVWLTSLSAQAPLAGTASQAGFTINGKTYSHDGVARLLARLALVPHLSNVTLQHSTVSPGEGTVVEFSIVATVKAPGAV